MVIQHNMQAMNANRMLGVTTGAQAKSTEKLSSGYRINRAADDAAGLTISEKMRRQIRGLTQASTNAEDGISCVQTAEGAMTEIHSMLQRMNELAVQASNGTMAEKDRTAVQQEVDALITEIDRVAETTKFNEIYLLKGDAKASAADGKITYELTETAKAAEKGALAVKAGAANAYGLGETDEVKGTTSGAAASMKVTTTPLYVSPSGGAAGGGDITQVTDAMLSTYFDVADDGTVTKKAAATATFYDGANGAASAVTTFTTYITGTAKTNAVKGDIDKYVEVAENGSLKYKDGQMLYTAQADDTNEYGTQVKNTMIAEADLGNYFESSANPLTDSAGAKITDLSQYFDEEGTYKGGIYRKNTAGASTEIGAEQIEDYVKINGKPNPGEDSKDSVLKFKLHVGSESDESNKIIVEIKAMSAAGIGIDGLKTDGLMTEDDATNAIKTIADAIDKVSTQRSALGAIQNRLEHTIANLDNVVENTTSAESRIRDVDMAEEMVEYSKNNILAQAGQSMLAQANQSTQGVLSLLG